MDKETVRVWFSNRRQTERKLQQENGGGGAGDGAGDREDEGVGRGEGDGAELWKLKTIKNKEPELQSRYVPSF